MKYLFHRVIFILCVLLLSGCGRNKEPFSKTDFVMDTVATVTVYDDMPETEANEILTLCFDEIRRYERLFSAEIPGSDVDRINSAKGETVEVSKETAELIDTALKYSVLSDGAFDITIRPVSKLWDFRSGSTDLPDKDEISEALDHVSYENIILDKEGSKVSLKDPEAGIELGAIAKGYTGDRIRDLLMEKGVKSAIINLGGNVVLIGKKRDGSDFKIGVEKPFGKEGEMIKTIDVSDASVVTSGNYERYFKRDGKIYHHLLDTGTGYPADTGLNAVTVISEKSVDGDALSTACFCLGREGTEKLINSLDDKSIKVYLIDSDNEIEEVK